MDFREYLEVAEALAKGDTEGQWRSAISRAYYAAFHVACDFLTDLGFQVPRMERAHAYSWLRLGNSSMKDINDSGNALNSLRTDRNRADYDPDKAITQNKANLALESAQAIITVLDGVTDNAVRKLVQEAVKTYERDVLKEITWKPS